MNYVELAVRRRSLLVPLLLSGSAGPLGGFGNATFELVAKVVYLFVPTILKIRGYRFFFFSREGNEPEHIHFE